MNITITHKRHFSFLTFLLTVFFWVLGVNPLCWAIAYSPERYDAKTNYGEGIYYAPYHTVIYSEPKDDAPILEELIWSHQSKSLSLFDPRKNQYLQANQAFVGFYPDMDVAMMAVIGENGTGWAEVVYDQLRQKTGWIHLGELNLDKSVFSKTTPPAHLGKFQTWMDFMRFNAKTSGIYWLSGVSDYQRGIRMSPEDTAKLLNITYIRDIKVKFVRGNWLLVEVLDFDRTAPIGWVRWRDENGKLLIFPNLSGQSKPYLNTF